MDVSRHVGTEIRKKIKKRRCPLHLDKEDIKRALLSCPENIKLTMGFLKKTVAEHEKRGNL